MCAYVSMCAFTSDERFSNRSKRLTHCFPFLRRGVPIGKKNRFVCEKVQGQGFVGKTSVIFTRPCHTTVQEQLGLCRHTYTYTCTYTRTRKHTHTHTFLPMIFRPFVEGPFDPQSSVRPTTSRKKIKLLLFNIISVCSSATRIYANVN